MAQAQIPATLACWRSLSIDSPTSIDLTPKALVAPKVTASSMGSKAVVARAAKMAVSSGLF